MSLSTLIALDQFTGNGSTVIFDMNSKYYNDSDVVVVLTDAAGVDTTQTITTHYTLSRKAENAHDATKGRITMVTAPAGGGTPEKLTIYKKPALTQLLILITTGGWYSLEVEEQFDLLVMIAQDFQLQLDRCSKYAYTNLDTPISLEALMLLLGVSISPLDMEDNNIINIKTATFAGEVANTGTTPTINWGAGQKQKLTLTGNTTPTDPFTAPAGPCNLVLRAIQAGSGSYTISWPAAVKWIGGGTPPTLSTAIGAVDIISFYYDGTNYHGAAGLDSQ